MKKKIKKAEMTSKMIVTIALLLAGFVILLIAYSQFGEGDMDREVCHESVILRGTLPDTFDIKNLPALKCKTRKVCITNKLFGKGECDEFKGQDYDTFRISKDKQENEINSFIANEMEDCWSMMGEGKLQIFTRDVKTKKRCSICSRIAFDKSIKETTQNLNGLEEYFIDNGILGIENTNRNFNLNKFSTEQKAIVFIESTKTDAPSWIGSIFGGAGGCYGGGLLGVKVGALLGAVGGATGAVVGCIGGIVVGSLAGEKTGVLIEENLIETKLGKEGFLAGRFFMDYGATKLQELECSSFESIS